MGRSPNPTIAPNSLPDENVYDLLAINGLVCRY